MYSREVVFLRCQKLPFTYESSRDLQEAINNKRVGIILPFGEMVQMAYLPQISCDHSLIFNSSTILKANPSGKWVFLMTGQARSNFVSISPWAFKSTILAKLAISATLFRAQIPRVVKITGVSGRRDGNMVLAMRRN